MRLQHSTLDGLSTDTFAHEVRLAITLTDAVGLDEADELARSYGLQPATRAPTADVEYDVGDEVPPDDRDRRRAG